MKRFGASTIKPNRQQTQEGQQYMYDTECRVLCRALGCKPLVKHGECGLKMHNA